MDWTKAWPEPGEPSTGLWSSGAAEECASGNSSEVLEESTPSAYDNLDRVSSCQKMEDDTSGHFDICDDIEAQPEEKAERGEEEQTRESSSSWSSCEVLPLDENNSVEEGRFSSHVEEEESSENGDHEHSDHNDTDNAEGVHHRNSPAACSARSGSPLSTGSSEVFLPSGPSDCQRDEPRPRDTQSLLFDLRQQMIKQKLQYQARIQR